MQRAFLDINGVRTNVITYGKWVEESFQSTEAKDVILIIPGNPGVTGFYKMFMHTLHEKTGFPVWIVGHAGHELPKKNILGPVLPWAGHEDLFGFKAQIAHKVDFIQKYVPHDCRLHLVGHSVGSYISLTLLNDETINSRVADVSLLFPAIEHIKDTPNGKFLTNFIKPIIWLILFLAWVFTVLPTMISSALLYIYMKLMRIPMMHFRTLFDFVHPSLLEKVFCMAYDEFDHILARDDNIIKANIDKIRILYGRNDGWTPMPMFYDRLKRDIPQIQAEISLYDHTFVLRQSRQIGAIVAGWILTK